MEVLGISVFGPLRIRLSIEEDMTSYRGIANCLSKTLLVFSK